MKRFYRSILLALTIVASAVLSASLTACGSQAVAPTPPSVASTRAVEPSVPAPGTVTASAVVVPAQISEMSFILSAPVKEVAVEEGDKVQAGQALVMLDTPDLEYAVVGAEAALRSAQVDAELQRYTYRVYNRAGKVLWVAGPPEVRQRADARVVQAQAALEVTQGELARGTLVAPYGGTVVKIDVVPGELVQPNQAVITLGDLDHLQIETTDLSERDVPGVKIGQSASVSVEALNADFNGKVVAISPISETVGGDVVYKVIIELDEQPEGLLWGMSAEVEINAEQ